MFIVLLMIQKVLSFSVADKEINMQNIVLIVVLAVSILSKRIYFMLFAGMYDFKASNVQTVFTIVILKIKTRAQRCKLGYEMCTSNED